MTLLWVLLIGLAVGVSAKIVMPGKDPGGFFSTMLLGVAGSFLAYFVGRALGYYESYQDGPGLVASILGAIVVLGAHRVVTRRPRAT